MSLHDQLKAILVSRIEGHGICGQLNGDEVDWNFVYEMFSRWPAFSGNDVFPVKGYKGATDFVSCRDSYGWASQDGRLWDKTTEYGRDRWSLLNFCIKETANELA